MAVSPTPKLTYADYLRFPDDGLRRELIDGEVHVTPSPNTRHQRIVLRVARLLASHVEERGLGEVFVAPFDVVLSEHDVVEPDVVFVAAADAGILTDANIRGAPTLVVEVLSDEKRDRRLKRDLYARSGVAEYWIVGPEADRFEVYRLVEGGYEGPAVFGSGDHLASDLLPGLALDVAAVLRR